MSGKRSRKKLVKDLDQSEEKSNHTAILEDIDVSLDFEDFQFEKKNDRKKSNKQPKKQQKGKIIEENPPIQQEQKLEKQIQNLQILSIPQNNEKVGSVKKQTSITNFFTKGDKSIINQIRKQKTPEKTFLEETRGKNLLQSALIEDTGKKKTQSQFIDQDQPQQKPQLKQNPIENKRKDQSGIIDQVGVQKGQSYKDMFGKGKADIKPIITTVQGDQLKGQKIIISGIINICSRNQLEQTLKDLGATIQNAVSGVTTLLIIGEKLEDGRTVQEGNKFKMAVAKGKRILREDELSDWLKDLTGMGVEDIFGDSLVSQLYQKSLEIMKDRKIIDPQESWTDKYIPRCLPDLVGHRSCIDSIANWLNAWGKKIIDEQKKPNFMMMQLGRFQLTGDKNSKACMISGPPGVGKSSTVKLLSEVLGYEILITNASEQRNKSSVKTGVGHVIGNKLLFNRKLTSKFIIVMDEVDGMSGSDRGGIQQLIDCIKNTQVPIICICNDNEHPKIRSLMAHCYHIKFSKPSIEQTVNRLQEICLKEKLQMSNDEIIGVATIFDCDLRQSINFLQMMSYGAKKNLNEKLKVFAKDQVSQMNAFHAALILLNRDQREQLRQRQKIDFFFLDYDLMPLIIQDNYLSSMKKIKRPPKKKETKKQSKQNQITQVDEEVEDLKYDYSYDDIKRMSQAADCMAQGDILNRSIRRKQNWALMPAYGILSTLQPCELVGETLSFPKFPQFLGKNSTARKVQKENRLLKNLIGSVTFNASSKSMKFEYGPALFRTLNLILRKKFAKNDNDAAWLAVQLLENYNLTPEDLKTSLHDLMFNPEKVNLLALVEPQTKTTLTKLFNSRHQVLKIQGKQPKKKQQSEQNHEITIYNPALGEEGPIAVEQEQGEDEDSQNVEDKSKSKKKKVTKQKINQKESKVDIKEKDKKKPQKNKKVESSSEDEQLNGFIDDDEDDQ